MIRNYAPIVLFVYNRPWHTQQTVEALACNEYADKSDLIIYSDALKSSKDKCAVEDVRQFLKTIKGFKSVHIVEQKVNLGLAQSIISGVSEVVNQFGRVIVLEDDLVTSPCFVKYMNEALELYELDNRVISVNGYMFPVQENLPDTFFLKCADCWGWGTWQRGWSLFESDGKKLLCSLKQRKLLNRFNFFGAYRYTRMLRQQIKGKNQSWAIRWYATSLLNDKLTLYPSKTLVRHIGSDGSGTHWFKDNDGLFDASIDCSPVSIGGIEVRESFSALKAVSAYLTRIKPSLPKVILRNMKKLLKQ